MLADMSDRDAGKLPLLPGLHLHGQLDRDAAGAADHHLRDEPPPLPHHQKVSWKMRVNFKRRETKVREDFTFTAKAPSL